MWRRTWNVAVLLTGVPVLRVKVSVYAIVFEEEGFSAPESAEQAAPAKRAEDFIVTLIMLSVARSRALVLSNNKMTSSWSPASKSTVAYWQCGDGIS